MCISTQAPPRSAVKGSCCLQGAFERVTRQRRGGLAENDAARLWAGPATDVSVFQRDGEVGPRVANGWAGPSDRWAGRWRAGEGDVRLMWASARGGRGVGAFRARRRLGPEA